MGRGHTAECGDLSFTLVVRLNFFWLHDCLVLCKIEMLKNTSFLYRLLFCTDCCALSAPYVVVAYPVL